MLIFGAGVYISMVWAYSQSLSTLSWWSPVSFSAEFKPFTARVQKMKILSELLNDVVALCFCALLCTKCFLNAFRIHWRAMKSFHQFSLGANHWMFWLIDWFVTHLKWDGWMHWRVLPLGLFNVVIEWKCEGGVGGLLLVNMIWNKHLGTGLQ